MLNTVIFDMDDTLIDTGKQYHDYIERAANYTKKQVPETTTKEFKEVRSDIESERIHEHGFDQERFPRSLADAYRFLANFYDHAIGQKHTNKLFDIGMSIYDTVPDLLDGVKKVLRNTGNKYNRTLLYTLGEPHIQKSKINEHNFRKYFDEIHIVPHKNKRQMEKIINPVPARHTVMIGDSLRTEIKQANQLGMNTIYREPTSKWKFNLDDVNPDYSLKYLRELPSALEKINNSI